MANIIHYRDKCIGCAICFDMQPEDWRISQRDGRATLVNATVKKKIHIKKIPDMSVELSKHVSAVCPVRCIQID